MKHDFNNLREKWDRTKWLCKYYDVECFIFGYASIILTLTLLIIFLYQK